MTLVQKIATTTYATIKRLQGYQLLKNPKGSSPYQVNMIKCRRGLTPELDEVFFYSRINKTFEGLYPRSKNKKLVSTHIFDAEKEQISNKRNIIAYGGGILGYFRDKQSVSEKVLDSRMPLSLRKKVELQDKFDENNQKRHYYALKSNWGILEDFLGLEDSTQTRTQLNHSMPKSMSFLEILKSNLSQ